VASAWTALPEGAVKAQVNLGSAPELGVFVEAKIGSEVATTVPNGEVIYVLSTVDDQWSEVMAPDGTTGYAISSNLSVLPSTMIETDVSSAMAGIYTEPNVTADIIATLGNGVAMTYVAEVDDYWIEVYHPSFGVGYGMKDAFGNIFFVAENQTNDAVVRAGPSSFTSAGVAQLAKGAKVVVTGKNAEGTWVKVTIPFSELDFGENGVSGWMAEFLFQNNVGQVVFDDSILSVVG
jgi:SH3-like domain-containing protein